jgi:hypothetical protein
VLSAVYIEILPFAKAFLEAQTIPRRIMYLQIIPLTLMTALKLSYDRVKQVCAFNGKKKKLFLFLSIYLS